MDDKVIRGPWGAPQQSDTQFLLSDEPDGLPEKEPDFGQGEVGRRLLQKATPNSVPRAAAKALVTITRITQTIFRIVTDGGCRISDTVIGREYNRQNLGNAGLDELIPLILNAEPSRVMEKPIFWYTIAYAVNARLREEISSNPRGYRDALQLLVDEGDTRLTQLIEEIDELIRDNSEDEDEDPTDHDSPRNSHPSGGFLRLVK